MRVYCTGRHSEPHPEQPVYPVLGVKGEVFECVLCKYDVHVDRDLEDNLDAVGDERIELHHLAQLASRAREELTP